MLPREYSRFAELLGELSEVFGKKIDDVLGRRYFEVLKDVPIDAVETQAREHMREGKFFPKPRDLRPRKQRQSADSDERGKSSSPEPFTPAWHVGRRAVMAAIAKVQRERRVPFTDEQRETSRLALAVVESREGDVGREEVVRAYESQAKRALDARQIVRQFV